MFKRKIYDELLRWKKEQQSSTKHKALIIKGLRQIGKTYIAMYFANENYENIIYLNFKENHSLNTAFSGDLNVDTILLNLSAKIPSIKLIPQKTIIVMDEIQECAAARSSLKYFALDGRYDVLATGSLLGLKKYNRFSSEGPSVGYEKILYMKSMDFEEFLWAIGITTSLTNKMKEYFLNKEAIPQAIHESLLNYYKQYLIVGGMPDVIDVFLRTKNYNEVRETQFDLIDNYRDDFGKYLNNKNEENINFSLKEKLNQILDSLPSQLAKENKKFQYKGVSEKARKSSYEEAIQWLIDYGLIIPCYNLSNLELPLDGNKNNDEFKLYFADTGLFVSLLEPGTASDILEDNLGIYKGAIYEEMIADAFSKIGRNLYYYRKDSGLEIDFIIRYQKELTLVEVKAKSGKTKSATTILNNPNLQIKKMIKLSSKNISLNENKLFLPYYLSYLLENDM